MRAVMSASHVGTSVPLKGEPKGPCPDDDKWIARGRIVEHFSMEQSIPPYPFAFAVGDIVYKDVGPRTRIYSEPSPVLEAVAREFAKTEEMIEEGEKLFGEYEWGRFDLLVLPSGFVNGGMEHPRMVFLSPTVLVGDSSGASVVAHELAHSWTGNLVTHATCNDRGYKPYFKAIESSLYEVGRLRFLRHLYTCLLQGTSSGNGGKELAKRVYQNAKESYHPIAQCVVESLLAKYT